MKKILALSLIVASTCIAVDELMMHSITQKNLDPQEGMLLMTLEQNKKEHMVVKKVLDNGMTVLVRPNHAIPKVSVQIWYNVGSKDEKTGEKGIAHLIEHMIFKGTQKLSESDINELVHKLSGVCNAFTSYDYTGYLFDMPVQNWKEVLPVIADCMINTSFKEDHLSSEMKAVIQELKMRRDNYVVTLLSDLLSSTFPDHPYHYPIIGYKQDLWNVTAKELHAFYKKHYLPNNAALVVVGDVNAEDVFALAEKYFGHLPAQNNYKKEEFYWNQDLINKAITLYRDVQQPMAMLSFAVPGTQAQEDDLLEILSYMLGSGKSSRLYRKIVDEEQLATSLETFCWNMFEHSLFVTFFEPKDQKSIDIIIEKINAELSSIARNGVSEAEVKSALKKAQMKYYRLLEDNQKQAYQIGKYFFATGDENYAFKMFDQPIDSIQHAIINLCQNYLRPSQASKGLLMPLPETEKKQWKELQDLSDTQDQQILSARVRTSPVEAARYAHTIHPHKPTDFDFPKPTSAQLANGLTLLIHHNGATPKINIELDLKAKYYYDPIDKQGLANFVSSMLIEGTKKYTSAQFADELESRGMTLNAYPGGISMSMLHEDFQKSLEFLNEILTNCIFDTNEIEKVREQHLAEIKNFWDDPKDVASHIVKEKIYANHPYAKLAIGTVESISSITQKDLIDYYTKYLSPQGARMAIVGDLRGYDVPALVEKTLGSWRGPKVEDIAFPTLADIQPTEVHYPISRDQIVLCFAGLSINRKHPDYDKLLLFDQIFGGGVLGSMASRLFELREQSGLFYTISGSLIAQAGEQPGMAIIKTIVSLDRLAEAEKAIKNTIDTVIETLTPADLEHAKQAVINSLVDYFDSNASMAQAFLFLAKYNFPADFFDKRAAMLEAIRLDEVKEAARKILHNDKLLLVKIGRNSANPTI